MFAHYCHNLLNGLDVLSKLMFKKVAPEPIKSSEKSTSQTLTLVRSCFCHTRISQKYNCRFKSQQFTMRTLLYVLKTI